MRSIAPWRRIPATSPELSDLLASFDPKGVRAPLDRAAILGRLDEHGNHVGHAIVASLPRAGPSLDVGAVDAAIVEAHVELQRLSEEFDHGRRVAELVLPMLRAVRATRVTDLGCGLAYVPRYLASRRVLGDGVAVAGRDFNPRLIAEARALASVEGLEVDLAVGDATAGDAPPGIVVSTGVLHHLSAPELRVFFERQRATASGFAHFDFQPSVMTPFGAWMFHRARFRSVLARHDGVLSALRAHEASVLLDAAVDPAGLWSVALFGARLGPFPRVLHAVVGVRTELREALVRVLGTRSNRLGRWT